jgi:hypothetical protein
MTDASEVPTPVETIRSERAQSWPLVFLSGAGIGVLGGMISRAVALAGI